MEKKIERSWYGHGKKECLEAIEAANKWIKKEPDRLYDEDYALRYVGISIVSDSMEHWYNDARHGLLNELFDKAYNQTEAMDESEFFGIYASYTKKY